ncbi:MAG TPA: RnfABCDGE type electron transport complex subunit D [Magnetospirillum sp.]|nr:RnfABCDGE type electron transport complex subunit D [Magnetospirillum sp.]
MCLRVAGKPLQPTLTDGSAALTGWLLAMSLPPWAPWWVAVLGAVFAIPLAKHVFGGLGQNVFNPAMVARVALLVSFPVQMTLFVAPHPLFAAGSPGFADALAITFGKGTLDTMSAASALGYVKTELSRGILVGESIKHVPSLMDLVLGSKAGSMGETSALLVLLGGLVLLARRIISWHIPVAVMATVFALGTIANAIDPARFTPGIFHLLSGATFLGAFFIATDYVTSPVSKKGQLVFGFGIGLLTWTIRTFAGYPEGMAFAVLLMNALTPIIDQQFRPRVFGRTRKGEPLPLKGEQ